MMKFKTGIEGLDESIGGGIEPGSRNILYGPPGVGKTVFAMQFLWQGLREGETVAFDVMDKPFPRRVLEKLFLLCSFFGKDYEEAKPWLSMSWISRFHVCELISNRLDGT